MGITTVKELAEHEVTELISVFGKTKGIWLKQAASGIDYSPLKERDGSDQIGRIATLSEDTLDVKLIFPLLEKLAEEVISILLFQKVTFHFLL